MNYDMYGALPAGGRRNITLFISKQHVYVSNSIVVRPPLSDSKSVLLTIILLYVY